MTTARRLVYWVCLRRTTSGTPNELNAVATSACNLTGTDLLREFRKRRCRNCAIHPDPRALRNTPRGGTLEHTQMNRRTVCLMANENPRQFFSFVVCRSRSGRIWGGAAGFDARAVLRQGGVGIGIGSVGGKGIRRKPRRNHPVVWVYELDQTGLWLDSLGKHGGSNCAGLGYPAYDRQARWLRSEMRASGGLSRETGNQRATWRWRQYCDLGNFHVQLERREGSSTLWRLRSVGCSFRQARLIDRCCEGSPGELRYVTLDRGKTSSYRHSRFGYPDSPRTDRLCRVSRSMKLAR